MSNRGATIPEGMRFRESPEGLLGRTLSRTKLTPKDRKTFEPLTERIMAGLGNVGRVNEDHTFETQRHFIRTFPRTIMRLFDIDLKELGADAAFHALCRNMQAVNSSMYLLRTGMIGFLVIVGSIDEITVESLRNGLMQASKSMRMEIRSRYRESPRPGGLVDLAALVADDMRDAKDVDDAFGIITNSLRVHLGRQEKADPGGKAILLFLEGFHGKERSNTETN